MWNWWEAKFKNVEIRKEPVVMKEFCPKFPEIPVQEDYHNINKAGWEAFPVNNNSVGKSNIDPVALKRTADALGSSDPERLELVLNRIKLGAKIGCKGQFRGPSISKNSREAYKVGRQVTDAVACWVKDGYVQGPVEEEDVPVEAKINGILTRLKPNGSVRVILNLSAPRGLSVNDGIDIEEFPASMSSTQAWVKVLNKAGKNCWITKVDWADAYKHMAVAEEDLNLQWFEWGGKYFKELCLIFGCASSAGIYDATAKTVLDLVCRRAKFPKNMVCQHLDDMVAAAPQQSEALQKFVAAYQEVAASIGVKLAPTTDPDKAFLPCKQGVVFGVLYNTTDWTWSIPENKMATIGNAIIEICQTGETKVRQAQSVVGKLVHIKPLVPTGKFNFFHIMRLSGEANKWNHEPQKVLPVTEECCKQLMFWLHLLNACKQNITIPKGNETLPPWTIEAYTDAAGGSLEELGKGTGGVLQSNWFYVPWAKRINAGAWKVEGIKVGRKLSALELIGPLIAVVAARKSARGGALRIWVDNSGSVAIWQKGYSTSCALASCIVTTIAAVAAALNIKVQLAKITRCSSVGAAMADALSKADFTRFRNEAQTAGIRMNTDPEVIPTTLLSWIDKPTVDFQLANRILEELAETEKILGFSA